MSLINTAGTRPTLYLRSEMRQPDLGTAWPTLVAVAIIGLASGARLAYLLCDCPLDLSPDEGHYWDWSRHLDWSYYSKGPVVAWLIAASCALFGDSVQALTGSLMPAVRLPAVLCGGLTLWGCFLLTRRIYRSPLMALGVVCAGLTLPVLAAGSLLMTIDSPYVAAWTWALVVAHVLVSSSPAQVVAKDDAVRLHRKPLWGWLGLGLLVACGILTKYTMVLFLPSLALFLLLRAWCATGGSERLSGRLLHAIPFDFWVTCAVAALGCLPIVIWNAQHDWVTVLHVARQAGVQGEPTWRWLGPLEYCAGQFGLLLGFWFVPFAATMIGIAWRLLRGKERPARDELFLWCMAAPMFLTFMAFSLRTKVELNWPVTAYVSGMLLGAGLIARQWEARGLYGKLSRGTVVVALVVGVTITVLMHHVEWLYPLMPANTSVRRWDPTCRLRGWQQLAGEVERERVRLREHGREPLVAASGWALPGNLAHYLPDRPEVYSFARANGGRHSQYDFWLPNPISNTESFRGHSFVYVGELSPLVRAAFADIEPSRWVVREEQGREVARWQVTVCHGFKGFAGVAVEGY